MKRALCVLATWACVSAALAQEAKTMFDPATYQPLASDKKAFKPGDLLTVVIQENANASTTADSNAGRTTGLSVQADPWTGTARNASATLGTDSRGGGRTQRSGRLLAQLTVSVMGLEPNGNLIIYGRQDLAINGESQVISLHGRVRPKDVTDGNLVSSSRIADADIRFDGEGFISDKSRPGWVTQLLTLFGL